jgi:predicted PurR-regulated permease PerM
VVDGSLRYSSDAAENSHIDMDLRNNNAGNHLKTAGSALLNWWRAATLDALIVGVLWFIGLELIRVPWAPFWAILGGLLQLIPTFGGMIALIGPVISVAVTAKEDDWWRLGLVLGLYGLIVILDGLVIGPYILHRTTKVPWWAAFLGPILLGILIPFWGVLLAPPLLAVIYAFRKPALPNRPYGPDRSFDPDRP